jgi:exodeoxyribonuclease VII large subunit
MRHALARLAESTARLHRHTPEHRIERLTARNSEMARRLGAAVTRQNEKRGERLASSARALDAVSPLATLGRGYAIVGRPDGSVLRDTREIAPGDPLHARLAKGRLLCRVEETFDEEK